MRNGQPPRFHRLKKEAPFVFPGEPGEQLRKFPTGHPRYARRTGRPPDLIQARLHTWGTQFPAPMTPPLLPLVEAEAPILHSLQSTPNQ